LGDAFIHIIPETIEEFGLTLSLTLYILAGILFFFCLEKFIHWRHCHKLEMCNEHDAHIKKNPHTLAYMNLIGDAFHNLTDGMMIAGSYLLSFPVGLATTIAVILHEIPQEIGDFGVMLHAGLTKKRAIFYNFLSALTAIVGAVAVLLMNNIFDNLAQFILPITAGGFIYIAGSDLIPEMHKEHKPLKSLLQIVAIILGIAVMMLLLLLE
ncbi:MAG: ZIP family metal transporter, partial [Nanoarchaeota archaeon]|nr:ZIP family metal transporter [Nanoarchaeota archaeon]